MAGFGSVICCYGLSPSFQGRLTKKLDLIALVGNYIGKPLSEESPAMAKTRLEAVVQQVKRLAVARQDTHSTDAQLLNAFITSQNQLAFASLVQRHGAMVMGLPKCPGSRTGCGRRLPGDLSGTRPFCRACAARKPSPVGCAASLFVPPRAPSAPRPGGELMRDEYTACQRPVQPWK